jgi:hypothetical protein
MSEFINWVFNVPYYRVKMVKDMEILKTIIQPIIIKNDKNESDFIVSPDDRKAWSALKNFCYRDGKAFECYVDIDNAIPLIEDKKVVEVKEYLKGIVVKEVSMKEIKSSISINYGKDVEIKRMKEIAVSPEFVFRQIDQKITKDILSADEWHLDKKWIIAALLIIAALYVWFVVLGGHMPFT